MSEEQWSYFVMAAKNPQVLGLQVEFNSLGEQGWELVTSVTTVKTMLNVTGNDLVFVFKKPGTGHRPRLASGGAHWDEAPY